MHFLAHYEGVFRDRSVFEERNFVRRFEAIELLEEMLVVAAQPSSLVATQPSLPAAERLRSLTAEAVQMKAALGEVDDRLFARLRAEIAAGRHRGEAFRKLLLDYCEAEVEEGPGYDTLDIFVNRLCSFLPMPAPTRTLETEMVDFHKTPARVVLELARRIGPGEVFVDLGAGLGQVVLLVHLLTGVAANGLEIEPTFCRYAGDCAAGLGLRGTLDPGTLDPGTLDHRALDPGVVGRPAVVTFVESDARLANYSEGTIFFMYTPFTGELLEEVFGLLRQQSLSRTFTLATYGPCTLAAARQGWLRADDDLEAADTLCFFRTLPAE